LEEILLFTSRDGMSPAGHFRLCINIADMTLYSRHGNDQPGGDFLVRAARFDELQDIQIT